MLNVFKIKRYAGLFLAGFLPTISFYIGMMYGLFIAIPCFIVSSVVSILIASLIIKNPFTSMLEGKGLMTFHIDSTGVVRPFIMDLQQPYVKAQSGSQLIDDVYDRESVLQLSPAVQKGVFKVEETENAKSGDKEIHMILTSEEFNKARFQLWQYPLLIYNAQIKSLVTKEFLSQNEKQAFSEHGILYLNRKMEELTSLIRDFGRYIVELSKPKTSILKSKWFIAILIGVIVIIVGILGYPLIQQFLGKGGSAAFNAISKGGGAAVVPQ